MHHVKYQVKGTIEGERGGDEGLMKLRVNDQGKDINEKDVPWTFSSGRGWTLNKSITGNYANIRWSLIWIAQRRNLRS